MDNFNLKKYLAEGRLYENLLSQKFRTKASYWSCRLPRYASQLGLGANMNTFW